MNPELPSCLSFPFREIAEPEKESGLGNIFEGPHPRYDHAFSQDPSVAIRTLEARDIQQLNMRSIPNGGFNVMKWIRTNEDGTEALEHYHVNMLARLDWDSHNFVNDSLMKTRYIEERREKAKGLLSVLPQIRICPDLTISMANNDTLFFSITDTGELMVNKDRSKVFQWINEGGIYRFQSYIGDVEGEETEEAFRILASGSIRQSDIKQIRSGLDGLIENGGLTEDYLRGIARLAVSIVHA